MFVCFQKFQKQGSNVNFLLSGVKERRHIRFTHVKLKLFLLNENYEIQ